MNDQLTEKRETGMTDSLDNPQRRRLVGAASGAALATVAGSVLLSGCATEAPAVATRKLGRVLVVGGGYGGATAAKYIKKWTDFREMCARTLDDIEATYPKEIVNLRFKQK